MIKIPKLIDISKDQADSLILILEELFKNSGMGFSYFRLQDVGVETYLTDPLMIVVYNNEKELYVLTWWEVFCSIIIPELVEKIDKYSNLFSYYFTVGGIINYFVEQSISKFIHPIDLLFDILTKNEMKFNKKLEIDIKKKVNYFVDTSDKVAKLKK